MRSIAGKAVEVVDDARGLFDRTALCDPHSGYQHRVDRVEQAAVPHPVEMLPHRRERREVPGQLRPLTPRRRRGTGPAL